MEFIVDKDFGAVWVGGIIDDPSVPKLSKIDAATNRVVGRS